MPVDEQDLLETVVGDAFGDVQAEGDEHFGFDVDRTGKVYVVQVEPVGDRRQDEYAVGDPPPQFMADRFDEERVRVQRKMLAMLLG